MSVTSHSDGFQGQKDEIRKNKKEEKTEKTSDIQSQKQNKKRENVVNPVTLTISTACFNIIHI